VLIAAWTLAFALGQDPIEFFPETGAILRDIVERNHEVRALMEKLVGLMGRG
jgi:hypothetical protein